MNNAPRANLALLRVLGVLLLSLSAMAQAQFHAIGPGREPDVLALFAPHSMGSEVVEGWTLDSVNIQPDSITVTLRGPADAETGLHLTYREPDTEANGSASFVVEERGEARFAPARDAILAALQDNDDATFWGPSGLSVSALEPALNGELPSMHRADPWLTAGLGSLALLVAMFAFIRRRRATQE